MGTGLPGIGPETLAAFKERTILAVTPEARPYLKQELDFPAAELEIFFDVEVDLVREFCYLHGFIERRHEEKNTERYIPFFAEEPTRARQGHTTQ